MPRLLLVDDNPSIHRIAESLLAPTDVELTCVDSAAEALDRLEQGERFDVALVDTAMPGMDGWTLLTRLRAMDATAQMRSPPPTTARSPRRRPRRMSIRPSWRRPPSRAS